MLDTRFLCLRFTKKANNPGQDAAVDLPCQFYLSWLNSGRFQKTLEPNPVEEHIAQGASPQLSLPALD